MQPERLTMASHADPPQARSAREDEPDVGTPRRLPVSASGSHVHAIPHTENLRELLASLRRGRRWIVTWLLFVLVGCGGSGDRPDLVWGKRGVRGGELVKPRAIAIDSKDRLYLVDWTARIQGFDRDGNFLNVMWRPPDYTNGRPSGLSCDADDNVIVSDSHYHCIRVYSAQGELLQTVGGKTGSEPGSLGYISDCVRDSAGNFYASEFGENQRISKFDAKGQFLKCWGGPGNETGQFARIRAMTIGPDRLLYVADACNHRIQVFSLEGDWIRAFGTPGSQPGQLSYPYDVCFGGSDQTPILFVVEYGNHRVQKFTPTGDSLGTWGGPGREPGKLSSPWALAIDSRGRLHVVDSENDRVQALRP